jgi:hypothetical protein
MSALAPPLVSAIGPSEGLAAFAISLLIGGTAVHVAAGNVAYRDEFGGMNFEHAVVTALLGAVAWAALDGIPLIGPLLALVGWIAVIRWRYPGGWIKASVVGAAAWATAVVVLAALELLGVGSLSALGVPGA